MVHTDLNPSNVLVRDGAVVAVVDIGNAGSGTRATDLINLVWQTFQDPLDGVRRRLWTRILDLVGWEGAAVLAATQILVSLEVPIRQGRHDVVPGVVKRGHRALDELDRASLSPAPRSTMRCARPSSRSARSASSSCTSALDTRKIMPRNDPASSREPAPVVTRAQRLDGRTMTGRIGAKPRRPLDDRQPGRSW